MSDTTIVVWAVIMISAWSGLAVQMLASHHRKNTTYQPHRGFEKPKRRITTRFTKEK